MKWQSFSNFILLLGDRLTTTTAEFAEDYSRNSETIVYGKWSHVCVQTQTPNYKQKFYQTSSVSDIQKESRRNRPQKGYQIKTKKTRENKRSKNIPWCYRWQPTQQQSIHNNTVLRFVEQNRQNIFPQLITSEPKNKEKFNICHASCVYISMSSIYFWVV